MNKGHRQLVRVIEENCVNCHRCIAECPAKMCNDGSGKHVSINDDLCLGCGNCIDACTHGARVGVDDSEGFFAALEARKPIVAIIAPAIAANFPDRYLELNGWLKAKGVKACFDVSFGAELTVKSYVEHIKKNEPKCVIAQPCPSLVSFIEIYRPELIPHLAPADSPMTHTMKMIRRFRPEFKAAEFAVISPCYSKRREFDDTGYGDYNVTMKSLDEHFKNHSIDLGKFPKTDYDNPPAERAALFSTPGGLMRTAERDAPGIGEITRKIEGHPQVYHYFAHLSAEIEEGNAPIHLMIDCLNCEMGCNGGPGTLCRGMHPDVVEGAVEKRAGELRKRYEKKGPFAKRRTASRKLGKTIAEFWEPDLYRRTYRDKSAAFKNAIKVPTEKEFVEIYRKAHKVLEKDFLNCGACGYLSCEQMAVAIFNGLNRVENCRHYMLVETEMLHDQHRENVAQVMHNVAESSSERLRANMDNVRAFARVAEDMARFVEQSSASIEQMAAQIQSISSILDKNKEALSALKDTTDKGQQGLREVTGLVDRIEKESEGLMNASKIIQGIASQTNLLAMNASIEAAHAGEYGQGFAVVADEIRGLADGSGKQAKSIAQVLKQVKGSIDQVAQASDDSARLFERLAEIARTVSDQDSGIIAAMAEQSVGGRLVIDSLVDMKRMAKEVAVGADRLLDESAAILDEIARLSEMSQQAVID